ncbi:MULTISPECIES: hypothetical protein [unclassified Methylomonas]|uniref:lipase family protein n=1 Tax=unclassified Methylomonas TaxID=2608980 RepID=UPI00247A7903|nr:MULTISPECIES: hypothetical protein [unclassified Methylomonas]MDT4329169.1 hypothetical protein [Methylomonas sp. MV1]WGS87619.1 hypothetical protein QC632_07625 [Methylomonas sp. UP202]
MPRRHNACTAHKLGLALIPFIITGCTTMPTNYSLEAYQQLRDSGLPPVRPAWGGFDATEAASLLELCIELNNQDDRNNPNLPDPNHQYQAKPAGWQLAYDSRQPGNTEWNRIWPWDGHGDNPNDIKTNGLKPLNNAWLLAQSTSDPGHVAIAIRGTVGERRSILADAYATTIPAYAGVEYPENKPLPIVFAATPDAEVHLGFGYAAFSLLFDPERGILTQLQQRLAQQAITKITVTGHSQGAAVATLIHAFLYYATSDEHNPYQLAFTAKPALKSYLFAQPKPGNLQFSQDFARIAAETAYVINNDRDPVPQVPLSLETVSEVAEFVEEDNVSVGGPLDHVIDAVTSAKNAIRGSIAEVFTGHLADDFEETGIAASVERYFGDTAIELPDLKPKSLNYTLAGQLIPVFGLTKGGDCYTIGDRPDILLQHHATSYRKLIAMQLLGKRDDCAGGH